MNIEDNFNAADVYLEMANEKFSRGDYDGALVQLCSAYSHVRSLIEEVYKVSVQSTQADRAAAEHEKDLTEKLKWLQSQGGISSEGFGL